MIDTNNTLSYKLLVEKNNFNSLVLKRTSKQVNKPKGKLLPSQDPISAVATGTIDVAKDAKNLVKAFATGKSNDHDLGKMNDLGLKVGGLSIAAYLISRKHTKTTKLMELAGFGTFFATMALWPKVFIEAPLKAKFGFNIGQKYVDSQGRKKQFFQDNQYLPWDIWSDKKINNVADYMGISKDMKDREEFTQKKMQKIALQGRTLSMLTAGFGVPLVASLTSGAIEKALHSQIVAHDLKSAKAKVMALNTDALQIAKEANFDKKHAQKLDELFASCKGKVPSAPKALQINDSLFANFTDSDPIWREIAELINPLNQMDGKTDPDSLKAVLGISRSGTLGNVGGDLSEIYKRVAKASDSEVQVDQLAKELEAVYKKSKFAQGILLDDTDEITYTLDDIKGWFKNADKVKRSEIRFNVIGMMHMPAEEDLAKEVENIVDSYKPTMNFNLFREEVAKFYEASKPHKAKFKVCENFTNALSGSRAESYYTKMYQEISDKLMKELSPSFKNLKRAKQDTRYSYEIVQGILSNIAQGIGPKNGKVTHEYFARMFGETVDKLHKEDASIFERKLADLAKGAAKDSEYASLKTFDDMMSIQLPLFIQNTKQSIDNSALRVIMALDLERRIKEIKPENINDGLQEVIDASRHIIYRATPNAIAEKCLINDSVYQEALHFLFDKDMDKSILNALVSKNPKSTILDRLKQARIDMKQVCENLNNSNSPASVLGEPVANLFKKTAAQTYNNKLWMRVFGGATLGIIAITLFAQNFFGKVKDEKHYLAKGAQNAGK